jgi:hypothetical protein
VVVSRPYRPHRVTRVTGGQVAWTNTSSIPDADVLAAIRFVAKEVNLHRVVIHVKRAGYSRRTYGRAYWGIPRIANTDGLRRGAWHYLITVTDMDGYVTFLSTLAHEAKHIEQYRERTSGGETACNAFEKWVVRRWQETQRAIA